MILLISAALSRQRNHKRILIQRKLFSIQFWLKKNARSKKAACIFNFINQMLKRICCNLGFVFNSERKISLINICLSLQCHSENRFAVENCL